MIKKITMLLVAIAVVAISVVMIDAYRSLNQPLNVQSAVSYDLKPGRSLRSIAQWLKTQGLFDRSTYLIAYARLQGISSRLQAGEYLIEPGMSAVDLLQKMQAGQVFLHSFTIVEGWTFKQLVAAIRTSDTIKQTFAETADAGQIMAALGRPDQNPEGLFLPDTYLFPRDTTDVSFLKRAHRAMEVYLAEAWENRSKDIPIKNPYEALILASIIEKESAIPEERGLIAAVFINRLNKRMRLQTDPTVIYGIGDAYDGDIKFRDLRKDTPYNTYTRHGLPPTPIAMSGAAAIRAALNPVSSDALYFVSMGDGSHKFSTNLVEHEQAVDRYQRRRRQHK